MNETNKKALIEGLKELLRTSLMAILPVIIVDLQSNSFHWQTWTIAFVISLLSGVDKWLHKKDTGLMGNGLTGV